MGFSSPKQHINQVSWKSVTVELNALGDLNDPRLIVTGGIVTGGSLTQRPKRSLRCFLVEVSCQINEHVQELQMTLLKIFFKFTIMR